MFRVAQKTLERLEWSQVLEQLWGLCRTPQALLHLHTHARADAPEHRADDLPLSHDHPAGNHGLAAHASIDFPFEQTLSGTRERLAETSEARSLLDSESIPPLSGAMDLEPAIQRALRGGTLAPQELLNVASTLASLHATARYLRDRGDVAPEA